MNKVGGRTPDKDLEFVSSALLPTWPPPLSSQVGDQKGKVSERLHTRRREMGVTNLLVHPGLGVAGAGADRRKRRTVWAQGQGLVPGEQTVFSESPAAQSSK